MPHGYINPEADFLAEYAYLKKSVSDNPETNTNARSDEMERSSDFVSCKAFHASISCLIYKNGMDGGQFG